jgi:hypothetical protein
MLCRNLLKDCQSLFFMKNVFKGFFIPKISHGLLVFVGGADRIQTKTSTTFSNFYVFIFWKYYRSSFENISLFC